jgi:hypothetical protein
MIRIDIAIIQTIKNLETIAHKEGSTISALAVYREASEVISQSFHFQMASLDKYFKQYPELATDTTVNGEEIAVAIERNLRSRILIDTVKGVEAHIAERTDVRGLPLEHLITNIIELTREWDRIQTFKTRCTERTTIWATRCTHDLNANTLRLLTASLEDFLREGTRTAHLELQLLRGKLQDIFNVLKSDAVIDAVTA